VSIDYDCEQMRIDMKINSSHQQDCVDSPRTRGNPHSLDAAFSSTGIESVLHVVIMARVEPTSVWEDGLAWNFQNILIIFNCHAKIGTNGTTNDNTRACVIIIPTP